MLRVENNILRLIALGFSAAEAASQLCREVESALPSAACAVMQIDSVGRLQPFAAPSLPSEAISALAGEAPDDVFDFRVATGSNPLPIFVSDIANATGSADPKKMIGAMGFEVCWAAPLMGESEELIGFLALFIPRLRAPTIYEAALVATWRELCEIVLRRHRRTSDWERLANIDALTGLPNRTAFDAALSGMRCDQPGSWALIVLDLDNLKAVNDTLGHRAGDDLIRGAGQRLARVVSPDIAYRLGGDEFAVIIQHPETLSNLDAAALKIFGALETPIDCDGHAVVAAGSIGGAVLSSTKECAAKIHQNADFALYHAKETGRGGFVRYWPGIDSRINHRRRAIQEVASALEDERIEAYYQPVVRLDTREIIGVEALCRLRRASGEIIPARHFKDATSDAKVAAELTGRMLSIVARDLRDWREAGVAVQQIGVNVSTADFYMGDLMGKLEASFGEMDIPLNHVILEINEDTSIDQRHQVVTRQIERLRKSGVQVALDDFGTGHASLTHLLRVPVDEIKIDRSFVSRLWPDDPSMVIVQGLIDIARQLEIRVVAEGIETEIQASQLWSMGCPFGQGFEFSRAVDRNGIYDLLRRCGAGVPGSMPLMSTSNTERPVARVRSLRRAGTRS